MSLARDTGRRSRLGDAPRPEAPPRREPQPSPGVRPATNGSPEWGAGTGDRIVHRGQLASKGNRDARLGVRCAC